MEMRWRVSSSSAGLEILDGTKGSRGKKKSRRAVYLMPEAVAALKAHRLRYLEERVKRADRWEATWQKRPEASDLVFPSTVGGPMSRNNLARRPFSLWSNGLGYRKTRRSTPCATPSRPSGSRVKSP
jgi:integrase